MGHVGELLDRPAVDLQSTRSLVLLAASGTGKTFLQVVLQHALLWRLVAAGGRATLEGIYGRVKRRSPEATRTAVTEAARLFDEWNMTDATGVFDVLKKHAVSRQVCTVYVGFNNAMNQTAQEEEQIRTPRKAAEVILRRVLLRLEEALAAVETPEQRFCARDKRTHWSSGLRKSFCGSTVARSGARTCLPDASSIFCVARRGASSAFWSMKFRT